MSRTEPASAGGEPAPTATLELRYRRVLAVLPASYRRDWEEEMVETLLAGIDSQRRGRRWPSWPEAASVLALAVRLRLGVLGSERSLMLGEAVRFVTLSVLLVQVVSAVTSTLHEFWWWGVLPGSPVPMEPQRWTPTWYSPFVLGVCALPLLSLVAYLAAVLGRRRLAVAGVLAGLLLTVALLAVGRGAVWLQLPGYTVPSSRPTTILLTVIPVLGLAGFRRDAVPVRARPWLIALALGLPVETVLWRLTRPVFGDFYLDDQGIWCLLVIMFGVHWLTRGRHRPAGSGWPLALAGLATITFGVRVLGLASYLAAPYQDVRLTALAGLEALAMLTLAVTLAGRRGGWAASR